MRCLHPEGLYQPGPNTSTHTPNRAGVLPPNDAPSDSAAGPLRRSGRKRKSTAGPTDPRRRRMSSNPDQPVLDQLREMMREMREVREDVNRSETNTSSKIDSLSKKMTDRMGKTEQSVRCLSQDLASVRGDIADVKKKAAEDADRVEKLVEDTINRKLLVANTKVRRPRTNAALTGANLLPIG